MALILSVGVSVVYAAVWTGPTGTPPDANTPTPINAGTDDQVKDGGLSVNAFIAETAYVTGNITGMKGITASEFIKGITGVCIGSACRSAWPMIYEYQLSGCSGSGANGTCSPTCPVGWTKTDTIQVSATNNWIFISICRRTVIAP